MGLIQGFEPSGAGRGGRTRYRRPHVTRVARLVPRKATLCVNVFENKGATGESVAPLEVGPADDLAPQDPEIFSVLFYSSWPGVRRPGRRGGVPLGCDPLADGHVHVRETCPAFWQAVNIFTIAARQGKCSEGAVSTGGVALRPQGDSPGLDALSLPLNDDSPSF